MVTKAGSNQFHGSAWEFHRNDKLNARSFFQPRVPHQRQHQPGAAAGGRILTNKLFYFGSYQALTNRAEAGSAQALVPTDAQRLGDFSGLATALKNPVDGLTGAPLTDTSGALCVSANIINPKCISPAARNYLDRFVPHSASGAVVKLTPSPLDAYNWLTRFDYTVSSKNNAYFHYFRDHYHRTDTPGNIQYVDQDSLNNIKQYSVTDTHTFSPTFLNEATYSFMNAQSFVGPISRVPPRDMGINLDEGYLGVGMTLTVTGQFGLNFPGPERQGYRNWQWRDTMTLIKGKHTFKWGYEGMFIDFDLVRGNGSRSASFTGTRSGLAMADFMLGAFDNVSFGFGAADSFPLEWKHQMFFQDELKVTPRMTLDLGVRYEPWYPWKQQYGRYTSWQVGVQSKVKPDAPPGLLFVGDPGVPEKTVEGNMSNFAPRVGLAWDLNGNGKTVLRTGYGIYYNEVDGTTVHAAEAPWTGTVQLFNGRLDDPFASLNRALPPSGVPISGDFGCTKITQFPGIQCALYPLPLNFVYTDPHLKTPTVQHFDVSFQRQVAKDLMFDVAYIERRGYHLQGHRHFNPAQFITDPFTGAAPSAQNSADRVLYEPGIIGPTSRILEARYQSWYHGLELKANKRFSRGFMFSGFYTLSKALDNLLDSGAGLTAGVANPFDPTGMKGRAQFDRRHIIGFSWLWEQRRRFENKVVNGLLSGWAVSGVHNISSGAPINFVMGTDVALDGTGGASRQLAQLAPGATVKDIPRDQKNLDDFINNFFNTSAFVPVNQVARGIYGNMPSNVISGPAMAKSDIAVMRDFKLPGRDGLRLQMRGELFNAFNQVAFGAPNTNLSAGTSFGRITSAQPGRVGQVVAKVLW